MIILLTSVIGGAMIISGIRRKNAREFMWGVALMIVGSVLARSI